MLLAGLDIGTTGCKLSIFQTDGTALGSVYRDYPVHRGHGTHEVDAGAIWDGVREVIREAAGKFPGIAGIGITSFGETFVMLDGADQPLYPAMLYTDPRGAEECDQLVKQLGAEKLINVTGLNPHAMYGLPKLMWLKKHHPELYAQASHVLQMEDYIVYLLTGNAQIDYSLATRFMAFDIHNLCWSEEVCEAAGIDSALLSKPVPTGTGAGCIKTNLAAELGLAAQTVIVSVSHDQVAAAIGSGVFDESRTVDGAGTVQCNTPVFRSYDPMRMAKNNFCVVPFIKPGCFVTYAFSYTGGALVKWFVDNLAGYAAAEAKETGMNVHDLLEGEWDGTPTGILVLPHFAGAATPYMDAGSQGAFVGLTLTHTQQDLYRAVMEGVCLEMRLNQDRLGQSGVALAPLRATGGGAKSRVWMQMKADILNVPVTALESSEAGATGSAMLVGLTLGVFADLEQAAQVMIREKETFQPRAEVHARYEAIYARYRKLYDAVRPLI